MNIIDTLIHPLVNHSDDLRSYMTEPWRSRPFPRPDRYFYPGHGGEYVAEASQQEGLPGSDPTTVRETMDEHGVTKAILVPLTRGLLPDVDLGAAVCGATNRWLAETWLDGGNDSGRFLGTIRINPAEPSSAVTEIERWSGDSRFVQVAVPMQAHHPYGQRQYHPVWKAAAEAGLPVCIVADGGCGVDLFPSPVGYYRHHIEYSTLYPINFAYHLTSLIAEGVFEAIPELRIVFADGAFDLLTPLLWRLDKDWRGTRPEIPWVEKLPSLYARDQVRFISRGDLEGPTESEQWQEWAEVSEATKLLMYGSRFPHWDYATPGATAYGLQSPTRRDMLCDTARGLYRL